MNLNDSNNLALTAYRLRQLMSENVIASLFTDSENPDDFIAGYVRRVSPLEAVVESISPYGLHDGCYIMRNACVNEAVCDIVYAERLELLMKLNPSPPFGMPMPGEDVDYLRFSLDWAKENQRVVTVWTHTDSYIGFVERADDLRATIGVLDFMGRDPVPMQILMKDIELISLGSEEERMYETLFRYFSQEPGSAR